MKAAAMKSVMKKSTAMKTVMRTRRRDNIARGRYRFAMVVKGTRSRTSGGLRKVDIMKNKVGRLVSKKRSLHGRKQYGNISLWIESTTAARRELGISGWFNVKRGTALYARAKELHESAKRARKETGLAAPAMLSSVAGKAHVKSAPHEPPEVAPDGSASSLA